MSDFYVVTTGVYSDMSVNAVFDSKEDAEQYVADREGDLWFDDPYIEGFDRRDPASRTPVRRMGCEVGPDGRVTGEYDRSWVAWGDVENRAHAQSPTGRYIQVVAEGEPEWCAKVYGEKKAQAVAEAHIMLADHD